VQKLRSRRQRASRYDEGTYGELVELYLQHMDGEVTKQKIAPGTRDTYTGILKRTLPILGNADLSTFDDVTIERILDTLTSTPATHNNMLKALRRMFKFAKKPGRLILENPTDGVQPVEFETDGFLEWSDEQIAHFLDFHPIGSTAHLAVTLYLYTACRRSDVVLLGPKNIKEYDGRSYIEFVPRKGNLRNTKTVFAPLDPYIEHVLEQTETGSETFLLNEYRQPYSAKGFGNRMRKWIDAAGLPKDISSHGIRKRTGSIFAESQSSEFQIMAAHGHSSPKASEVYTRKAKRRVLSEQNYHNADITKRFGLGN
ncbi:MAG: tyrosine-type recombinase/integrase, partial [Sulfitobacter sp.]